jgi:CubicO group peptidase (beta-lactamase class C family)
VNRPEAATTQPSPAIAVHADQPGLTLRVHPAGEPPAQACTGLASLELAAPITENTAFNTGSVAKQITAHLLIRSARTQLLALNQPVHDILPRFRIPGVTVADLIQHHGGVRDAESLLSLAGFRDLDHYTADDLLELAYRQHHRAIAPGRFLYSNTGYLLLAEILRHIHGTSLQEIAGQQIFTPLAMTSARFQADPRQVIPGAAASYQPATAGWIRRQRPVALPGPGSLWCTADDLDRWLTYLHQERNGHGTAGRPLPSESELTYRPSDHAPCTYGPGLYADPRPGHTAVFHNGHEQGFSAAAHLTHTGLRVVCLSNHADIAADRITATALTELARNPGADPGQLLRTAIKAAAPVPPATSATGSRHSDPDAPEHTSLGTYTCDDVPGVLRLTRSDGTLYLWRRGTSDRLTRTSAQAYTGDGYVLTLYADLADHPRSFVLDLDRAPGLYYQSD